MISFVFFIALLVNSGLGFGVDNLFEQGSYNPTCTSYGDIELCSTSCFNNRPFTLTGCEICQCSGNNLRSCDKKNCRVPKLPTIPPNPSKQCHQVVIGNEYYTVCVDQPNGNSPYPGHPFNSYPIYPKYNRRMIKPYPIIPTYPNIQVNSYPTYPNNLFTSYPTNTIQHPDFNTVIRTVNTYPRITSRTIQLPPRVISNIGLPSNQIVYQNSASTVQNVPYSTRSATYPSLPPYLW